MAQVGAELLVMPAIVDPAERQPGQSAPLGRIVADQGVDDRQLLLRLVSGHRPSFQDVLATRNRQARKMVTEELLERRSPQRNAPGQLLESGQMLCRQARGFQ